MVGKKSKGDTLDAQISSAQAARQTAYDAIDPDAADPEANWARLDAANAALAQLQAVKDGRAQALQSKAVEKRSAEERAAKAAERQATESAAARALGRQPEKIAVAKKALQFIDKAREQLASMHDLFVADSVDVRAACAGLYGRDFERKTNQLLAATACSNLTAILAAAIADLTAASPVRLVPYVHANRPSHVPSIDCKENDKRLAKLLDQALSKATPERSPGLPIYGSPRGRDMTSAEANVSMGFDDNGAAERRAKRVKDSNAPITRGPDGSIVAAADAAE